MKSWTGSKEIVQMTGDKEIDNTLWYDRIINHFLEDNESSELATPFQEGSKEEIKTSSLKTSQSSIEPL